MPHDVNGAKLEIGDEVLIRARVTHLDEGEEYCNVTLSSLHGRRPDGLLEHFSGINTGVLEKVALPLVRQRTAGEQKRADKRAARAAKD